MAYTRGKKRVPEVAVMGEKVNVSFMCQAYLVALECAHKVEGQVPTLLLANWTKVIADKKGCETSMVATVTAEWFARRWVARDAKNIHVNLLATQKVVEDYQSELNGTPQNNIELCKERGCLDFLREQVEADGQNIVIDPTRKLVAAGLSQDSAIKMLRVLSLHGKIESRGLPHDPFRYIHVILTK